MKKITLVIFIFAFILFRPYQLQTSGMLYSVDDYSYMAHATSLTFFQFPSYAKECFTVFNDEGMPLHSIGPALLASPFVFFASIVDRIYCADIIYNRTAENIIGSWTVFGFLISSIFYLWLTCFFLYKGITYYVDRKIASITVILAVLCQGVPLFVFRRPVFSHIYEIFIQSLFVFLLLRINKYGGKVIPYAGLNNFTEAVCVGMLISLTTLVRYNNIFISLLWPIILFSSCYPKTNKIEIVKMIVISYLTMFTVLFIFVIWPILYNYGDIYQYRGYFGCDYEKKYLLTLYNPILYIKRLGYLLWGIDWGLIFTAPYLLLGLFSLIWIKKDKMKKNLIWLLLPMAITLYITLSYRFNGSWYGYRYLIFSFIPIIVYPLAKLIYWAKTKHFFLYCLIIVTMLFPVLSVISFEGNTGNLTLALAYDEDLGISYWRNDTYQLEIYKTILKTPFQYFIHILKAGPVYIAYILSVILKYDKYLPSDVYKKYLTFEMPLMIKTMIVYLFPFVLLLVFRRYDKFIKKIKK